MKRILLVCLTFMSLTVYATSTLVNSPDNVSHTEQMVGGWYPVFFDEYDKKRVNELISTIKTQKIAKIVISYEDNQNLANQIKYAIISKVKCNLIMEKVDTRDNSAQFHHDRVVVVVYNKV